MDYNICLLELWILAILALSVEVKPSLIFYNTPTTWPEARTFCANVGGKLASRSTEMTSHVTKDSQLVWTGTYQTFSNFAAKIGCQNLLGSSPSKVYELDVPGWYYCQQYCSASPIFSYQNGSCYCLKNETLLTTNNDGCSGNTVYRHSISGILPSMDNVATDQQNCLTAQCQGPRIIYRSEDCNKVYEGICTNGVNIGIVTHSEAVGLCNASSSSFINWYESDFCVNGQLNQSWTSATRYIYAVDVQRIDVGADIVPISCQYANITGNSIKTEFGNCMDSYAYFCIFESEPQENMFLGIIVYVALGCVFILIVSLVFIATTTPKKGTKAVRTRKKSFEEIFGELDDDKSFTPVDNRSYRSYSIQIADIDDNQSGTYLDMTDTLKKHKKGSEKESISKKSRSIRLIDDDVDEIFDGSLERERQGANLQQMPYSHRKDSGGNNSKRKHSIGSPIINTFPRKGSFVVNYTRKDSGNIPPPPPSPLSLLTRNNNTQIASDRKEYEDMSLKDAIEHIEKKRSSTLSQEISSRQNSQQKSNKRTYTEEQSSKLDFYSELTLASRRISERKQSKRHTPPFPLLLDTSLTNRGSKDYDQSGENPANPKQKSFNVKPVASADRESTGRPNVQLDTAHPMRESSGKGQIKSVDTSYPRRTISDKRPITTTEEFQSEIARSARRMSERRASKAQRTLPAIAHTSSTDNIVSKYIGHDQRLVDFKQNDAELAVTFKDKKQISPPLPVYPVENKIISPPEPYNTDVYDNVDLDFEYNSTKFKIIPGSPFVETSKEFDITANAELAEKTDGDQANAVIDDLIKELSAFEDENFPVEQREESLPKQSESYTQNTNEIFLVEKGSTKNEDNFRYSETGLYDDAENIFPPYTRDLIADKLPNEQDSVKQDNYSAIVYTDNYSDIKDADLGTGNKGVYHDVYEPQNDFPNVSDRTNVMPIITKMMWNPDHLSKVHKRNEPIIGGHGQQGSIEIDVLPDYNPSRSRDNSARGDYDDNNGSLDKTSIIMGDSFTCDNTFARSVSIQGDYDVIEETTDERSVLQGDKTDPNNPVQQNVSIKRDYDIIKETNDDSDGKPLTRLVSFQGDYDDIDETKSKTTVNLQGTSKQNVGPRPPNINMFPSDDYDELEPEETYMDMSAVDTYVQSDRLENIPRPEALWNEEPVYALSEKDKRYHENSSSHGSAMDSGEVYAISQKDKRYQTDQEEKTVPFEQGVEPIYAISSKQSMKKRSTSRESNIYDKLHENRLRDRKGPSSLYNRMDDLL